MGSLAVLAKELGYRVTGSDQNCYPPMSTQLESIGIELYNGYGAEQLELFKPDLIVVGNAMRRGYPVVEAMLEQQYPYVSGPQWLAEHVLQKRWVIACSGTHGKTTTSSMVAWILQYAGLEPGFLIGGVPHNFSHSATLGKGTHFVIEADEYDTAFFDKRSKFIQYRAKTLIMNNIEFDHADIFVDLEAVKQQFHYLVRTVPANGVIIHPKEDSNIQDVLTRGCWTPCESLNGVDAPWNACILSNDGSAFSVIYQGKEIGDVRWNMLGEHNVNNALAAIAAAVHAGVSPSIAIEALSHFSGVKRRMELIGSVGHVDVYDDFAHHPTAIETTIAGLRNRVKTRPISAVLECGSYTMRSGVHRDSLGSSVREADRVFLLRPEDNLIDDELLGSFTQPVIVASNTTELLDAILETISNNEAVLIMSNKGFGGIHQKLLERLARLESEVA